MTYLNIIPWVTCGEQTLGAEQKWKQGNQLMALSIFQKRDGSGFGQSGCSGCGEQWVVRSQGSMKLGKSKHLPMDILYLMLLNIYMKT